MLVTDAWTPQINGVVTTMQAMSAYLQKEGHQVEIIHPGQFLSMPMPTYPEIRLSLNVWRVIKKIKNFNPDHIHLVTEGPLGWVARAYLNWNKLHYTSAFHTKLPEYIHARLPFISVNFGYRLVRYFHQKSACVLVPTEQIKSELRQYKINHTVTWTRGVDPAIYHPLQANEQSPLPNVQGPVYLCVARLAPEKNIETFLQVKLAGTKVIVGDGPLRKKLESAYPDALFVGYQIGRDLARYYAVADVFVFPSLTDTYGVVMLESMACGTPVAAFNVTGPINVVQSGKTGILTDDISPKGLGRAIQLAQKLNGQDCLDFAKANSWDKTGDFLLKQLVFMSENKAV